VLGGHGGERVVIDVIANARLRFMKQVTAAPIGAAKCSELIVGFARTCRRFG
jgi:hypothetical protein